MKSSAISKWKNRRRHTEGASFSSGLANFSNALATEEPCGVTVLAALACLAGNAKVEKTEEIPPGGDKDRDLCGLLAGDIHEGATPNSVNADPEQTFSLNLNDASPQFDWDAWEQRKARRMAIGSNSRAVPANCATDEPLEAISTGTSRNGQDPSVEAVSDVIVETSIIEGTGEDELPEHIQLFLYLHNDIATGGPYDKLWPKVRGYAHRELPGEMFVALERLAAEKARI